MSNVNKLANDVTQKSNNAKQMLKILSDNADSLRENNSDSNIMNLVRMHDNHLNRLNQKFSTVMLEYREQFENFSKAYRRNKYRLDTINDMSITSMQSKKEYNNDALLTQNIIQVYFSNTYIYIHALNSIL